MKTIPGTHYWDRTTLAKTGQGSSQTGRSGSPPHVTSTADGHATSNGVAGRLRRFGSSICAMSHRRRSLLPVQSAVFQPSADPAKTSYSRCAPSRFWRLQRVGRTLGITSEYSSLVHSLVRLSGISTSPLVLWLHKSAQTG
jgi:hypothetical protein